ncbi:hypothetical protein AVEN_145876-1 [Araneus ventricosus]|uniref:Uncharacterized protein n=1 Tax=Araneus ventricosus TaxID=182803 RepID=A0A4Y2IIU4_ARAVE|nr:hypothetical protein AVEN_145876-1 [Araneus ventricosus]
MSFVKSIDFGMKRQNSFDVSNPAGSDRIEIGAGLQSLADMEEEGRWDNKHLSGLTELNTRKDLKISRRGQDTPMAN